MKRESAAVSTGWFGPSGVFSSLGYRNYRYIWLLTFATWCASWLHQLTIGWYAFKVTDSSFLTATIVGMRFLPYLLVGPVGGVLADRFDRRRMLALVSAAGAVAAASFGVLMSLDLVQTWHLFLFAMVGGMAVAMGEPPRQSLLAQSLPREQLTNGNALAVAAVNMTRSVGPFLGGYLIAYFGPDVNFYLQSAFHASVIPLALAVVMPPSFAQPASGRPPTAGVQRAATNLASGFRYVLRERIVLGLILTGVVPLIFIWFFPAGLLPVFAEEVLHEGPEELGILVAMAGIGGFAGTLTLASGRRFRSTGKAVYATGVLSGLSMSVFSFMHWFPLAVLVMFVVGVFQYAYITHQHALLQAVTPPEYRGRVTGIFFMCLGLSPVTGLVAGVLASRLGADWTLFFAGMFVAVSMFTIPALFPTLRHLAIREAEPERKLAEA